MKKVYTSNRLTGGNAVFPDKVIVDDDGIHFIKSGLLKKDEEIISYNQIASVKISSKILFSDVLIETSGGSQPVFINGLSKRDAQEIKQLIKQYRENARDQEVV